MHHNPSRMLFVLTLMLGSAISISSTTWWGAWVGLEVNMMSFIPIMVKQSKFPSEAALKYFLIQALASSCLLMLVITLTFQESPSLTKTFNDTLMSMTLLIKIGAAPFHMWFPVVSDGLDWHCNMILMTWQKIAPFIMLLYLNPPLKMLALTAMLSAVVGAVGGFNQTSLRKIMAFSSINHIGWMLSASIMGLQMWLTYFLFYSFLNLLILMIFQQYQLNFLPQMFGLLNNQKMTKLLISINLLSIGGLPPFIGFFPKWTIMLSVTNMNNLLLLLTLVMSSLITLYFYLRIIFSSILMNHHEQNKMKTLTPPSMMIMMSSSLSIFGLAMTPMFNFFA